MTTECSYKVTWNGDVSQLIGFISLFQSICVESLSGTGWVAYMTTLPINGKFPSSWWLGNRRPLLKECKTQQFGFHWTGLVVSTYITSIWRLKGNKLNLLVVLPESSCCFRDVCLSGPEPWRLFLPPSPWISFPKTNRTNQTYENLFIMIVRGGNPAQSPFQSTEALGTVYFA